jgi:hypothetical protein
MQDQRGSLKAKAERFAPLLASPDSSGEFLGNCADIAMLERQYKAFLFGHYIDRAARQTRQDTCGKHRAWPVNQTFPFAAMKAVSYPHDCSSQDGADGLIGAAFPFSKSP